MQSEQDYQDLVKYVQTTPLNEDNLQTYYDGMGFDRFWVASTALMVQFELSICSYEGMAEVPLFWRAFTNDRQAHEYSDANVLSEYRPDWTVLRYIIDIYNALMRKELEEWKFLEIMKRFGKTDEVNVPYSRLWSELERGEYGGAYNHQLKTTKAPEGTLVGLASNKSLHVVVADSWESLYLEEAHRIFKLANFCNNCGKALPFEYNGKYCPEIEENIDCIRERNRKRKNSQLSE